MDARPSRLIVAGQLLAVCAAAALLVPAISPGAAVHGGALIKLLFLARIGVMIGLATWFLRVRGLGWANLGLSRPRWLWFGLAIVGGIVVTIVAAGVVGFAISRAGLPRPDYSMFSSLTGNLPEYLFWLLPVTWASAAFGEELLFRGFVRDALERLFGRGATAAAPTGSALAAPALKAIVAQAVLFGSLHLYQGIGGATMAGTIGLVLGFVWLFSGRNLWAGIVVHGLIDSTAMTAIYLGLTQR